MTLANEHRQITGEELKAICLQMEEAERSGMFNEIFKGDIRPHSSPSRRELLDSMEIGMKLFKSTFLKIFSYNMTTPGFAEEALSKLEAAGCSQARNYYTSITTEWQREHDEMMNSVAGWYRQQAYKGKKVNEPRKQQEPERLTKERLQQISNENLLQLLKNLSQECRVQ